MAVFKRVLKSACGTVQEKEAQTQRAMLARYTLEIKEMINIPGRLSSDSGTN